MNARRVAAGWLLGLACASCSAILGIDGDVLDTAPPQVELASAKLTLAQGGTTTLMITRRPTGGGRLARVVIEGLPSGVVAAGTTDLAPGQSVTLTLTAAANALLGVAKPSVTAEEVGKTTLPLELEVTGHLDTSFGAQGFAVVPFRGEGEDFGFVLDAQDRAYVAFERGSAAGTPSIARINADGSLDRTFGTDGFSVVPVGAAQAYATALFEGADGLLLFGYGVVGEGSTVPFVYRPSSPPRLYEELGADLAGAVSAAGRTRDGFVGAGPRVDADTREDTFFFRTAADGSQATFANGARYLVDTNLVARAIAVDSDDSFVVVGTDVAADEEDIVTDAVVTRRLADGTLDSAFGNGGYVRAGEAKSNLATAVAFDAAGRIVVAGNVTVDADGNSQVRVARMSKSGIPDTGFGTGGAALVKAAELPSTSAKCMLPDNGKWLVGGAIERSQNEVLVAQTMTVFRLEETGRSTVPSGRMASSRSRFRPQELAPRRRSVSSLTSHAVVTEASCSPRP